MTLQIERRRAERREAERDSDEELSPEYLALLEICGGEIRAGDRAILAEKRQAAQSAQIDAAAPATTGKRDGDAALATPVSADRRAART